MYRFIKILTDIRYILIIPSQSLSSYHDQFGYGFRSGPPGPSILETVTRLAGTPFSLTTVVNILPSTKILFVKYSC